MRYPITIKCQRISKLRALFIITYTQVHTGGWGGGGQGQAYTLIFWLQFANNRHQAEMVGVDQPQTRKSLELLD